MLCLSQGEDADGDAWIPLGNGLGTGGKGSTSREDIIDKQDVPTGNARNGLKQVLYIFGPLDGCFVCLRLVVSGAFHSIFDYWNPRHIGYAEGYLGTLVVAALPLANPM